MNLNRQVFVVDDDAVNNIITVKMIQMSRLAETVTICTTAAEALGKLSDSWLSNPEGFPEILFLDIKMPDMDGWEFLNTYSKFPAEALGTCKVIMLTSSINLFDIRKAKSYPVVKDYLIKPLQVKMLETLGSGNHTHFSISQSVLHEI